MELMPHRMRGGKGGRRRGGSGRGGGRGGYAVMDMSDMHGSGGSGGFGRAGLPPGGHTGAPGRSSWLAPCCTCQLSCRPLGAPVVVSAWYTGVSAHYASTKNSVYIYGCHVGPYFCITAIKWDPNLASPPSNVS